MSIGGGFDLEACEYDDKVDLGPIRCGRFGWLKSVQELFALLVLFNQ